MFKHDSGFFIWVSEPVNFLERLGLTYCYWWKLEEESLSRRPFLPRKEISIMIYSWVYIRTFHSMQSFVTSEMMHGKFCSYLTSSFAIWSASVQKVWGIIHKPFLLKSVRKKKLTTFEFGHFSTIFGHFFATTQISFTKFRFWQSFWRAKHVEIPIRSKSMT